VYQLHLGISDDLAGDLRAFADEHELSISAATRLAILRMVRPGGSSPHDKLTKENQNAHATDR
jgi:hypothetical protein